MNKKLFTFAVSAFAMLAGSLSTNAQVVTDGVLQRLLECTDHSTMPPLKAEVEEAGTFTPTRLVESADMNNVQFVAKIESNKYYQILISKDTRMKSGSEESDYFYFLTMERDRKTGKLSLVARDGVNHGSNVTKLNESLWKIEPSTNDVNGYAYTITNKAYGYQISFDDAELTEGRTKYPLKLKGDMNSWRWYSHPTIAGLGQWGYYFGPESFYAFNHDYSKVYGLVAPNAAGFVETGVVSAEDFNYQNGSFTFAKLWVVSAGPRVLTDDEFNTMIDAANQPDGVKLKSNVTVTNPLFSSKIKAERLDNSQVDEEDERGLKAYFGYQLLFNNGKDEYFKVETDETYDYDQLQQLNGGLKLVFDTLRYAKNHVAIATTLEDVNAGLISTTVNPLTARYVWKATYWPTQDSLVLEPLNASLISFKQKQHGMKWIDCAVSEATLPMFFNTMNQARAYGEKDWESDNNDPWCNAHFNKVAWETVALTVYNKTGNTAYDKEYVLTVGQPMNDVNYYQFADEVASDPGTTTNPTHFGLSGLGYARAMWTFNADADVWAEIQTGKFFSDPTNHEVEEFFGDYSNIPVFYATANMGIKINFAREDNYLKRATLPNGLYFVQLASVNNMNTMRRTGKYFVDNHRGTMMYDSPTTLQNYNRMPATQWIVTQDTCDINSQTPEVLIRNREYGDKSYMFQGQLYTDGKNYFTINECEYAADRQANEKGMFDGVNKYDNRISYLDTLKFTVVTDPVAYDRLNGYAFVDSINCLYKEFNLKYLEANTYGNPSTEKYLNVAADSVLSINADNAGGKLAFQLVKLYRDQELNNYGALKTGQDLTTAAGTIEPLGRQAYMLKVRDTNLIDNEWKYIVYHQDVVNYNSYYKMDYLANVDGQINKLAVFYLKNDQITPGDSLNATALIDLVGLSGRDSLLVKFTECTSCKPEGYTVAWMDKFVKDDADNCCKGEDVCCDTEWSNMVRNYYKDYTVNGGLIHNDFTAVTEDVLVEAANAMIALGNPDDYMKNMFYTGATTYHYNEAAVGSINATRLYKANGWYRLAVEDQNAIATIGSLDNIPADRVSAFLLTNVERQLYLPLTDKGVVEGNNVKIYRERGSEGATKEYLFEDGNNAGNVAETAYIKGFNYLGITGENIKPVGEGNTTAMYVDSVINSQDRMPQYLLYVDRSVIDNGLWCVTGEHGYNSPGDTKSHQIKYNALSYGRVLVNLNDSIATYNGTSYNMLQNGKKYAYENYSRLGFVNGIHIVMGTAKEDSTSVYYKYLDNTFLTPGHEYLIILKAACPFDSLYSSIEGSETILDPAKVYSAYKNGLADVHELDGMHKNYAFSFRYIDDEHVNFLMESAMFGTPDAGYPGTFTTASWVKIQNSVPVLAQAINPMNGQHTAIHGYTNLKEVVNQSQIFTLNTTDEIATSNDEIAAAAVKVIAGEGVVTVKNAAGKNVVITNILGKIIASTKVTSDNATFAAPAGVVAVAVEGEAAVKTIVK